jgi:transcriptional regulator with XRE-family HTH domain
LEQLEENDLMKQPELGRKISQLRKAKGLTQEELVDKCNITVRTLQRIESGEVTPRLYTIKTIFAALEYELNNILENDAERDDSIWSLRKLLLLGVDISESSAFVMKQLNIAWVSGIVYFLTGIFEGVAEYYRMAQDRMIFGSALYVVLKLSVLTSFVFFQRGFVILGGIFKNHLLRIISYVLIFGNVLAIGYDIVSILSNPNPIEYKFVLSGEAFTFGGVVILFGVSLFRLQNSVGRVSLYAGLFEIAAGCCLLTIVLSLLGLLLFMPAELLEIVIIYKSLDIIKSKGEEGSFAT